MLAAKDAKLDRSLHASMDATQAKLQALVDSAEHRSKPVKFDQLIAEGNTIGAVMINETIDALVAQTIYLERAAGVLGIENLNPDNADHDF